MLGRVKGRSCAQRQKMSRIRTRANNARKCRWLHGGEHAPGICKRRWQSPRMLRTSGQASQSPAITATQKKTAAAQRIIASSPRTRGLGRRQETLSTRVQAPASQGVSVMAAVVVWCVRRGALTATRYSTCHDQGTGTGSTLCSENMRAELLQVKAHARSRRVSGTRQASPIPPAVPAY